MSTSVLRLGVAAILLASASMAQAVTISVGGCADPSSPSSGLTTCVSGADVVDFNSGTMPWYYHSIAGAPGKVVSGSLSGKYAKPGGPTGDKTPYLVVPGPGRVNHGTVTARLGTNYNYFGLYWGSMDAYNALSFYDDGKKIFSVTGQDVIAMSSLLGNQTSPGSNNYVNFRFGPKSYDQVRFRSNGFAFESDNHAYANVPEPGTLGLLGVGLLGLALARRRSTVR